MRHMPHLRQVTYVRRVTYMRRMTYMKVSWRPLWVTWLRADVEGKVDGGRLRTSCFQALYIALIYGK